MIKQDEANALIFDEWAEWEVDNVQGKPVLGDVLNFYAHLESNRTDLLKFRCAYSDRWTKIKTWFIEAEIV